MQKIIDISEHQGSVNFQKVKESGVEGVMIRAGYGNPWVEDARFKEYVKGCIEVGLPYGVYLYSYATTEAEARKEVREFLKAIKPYNPTLPVVIDTEDADDWRKEHGDPNFKTYAKMLKLQLEEIKKAEYTPMYYCSNYWNEQMNKYVDFSEYALWLAWWTDEKITLPKNCNIWQYSDRGKVKGISGKVDMNRGYFKAKKTNKKELTPRLSKNGMKGSKYWYSDDNPFYLGGYGLPNCTCYAWGRAWESTGTLPKLPTWDAQDWYNDKKTKKYYKRGQTPRVGAIVCYKGGEAGHVAFVEAVHANGDITISQSGWSREYSRDTNDPLYFWTARVSKASGYREEWMKEYGRYLQGFIYPNTKFDAKPTNKVVNSSKSLIKKGQAYINKALGSKIAVDGIVGNETRRYAIKLLQKMLNKDYNANLEIDGRYGPLTNNALGEHYVEYKESQYMVTAAEVLLYLHGYDPKGIENKGEFGSGLLAAVKRFQKDNGLTVDGIVGPKTFKKLIDL